MSGGLVACAQSVPRTTEGFCRGPEDAGLGPRRDLGDQTERFVETGMHNFQCSVEGGEVRPSDHTIASRCFSWQVHSSTSPLEGVRADFVVDVVDVESQVRHSTQSTRICGEGAKSSPEAILSQSRLEPARVLFR